MNFIRVAFQKKVCLVLVSKDFFSPLFYFFWRLLFLWVELNASVLDVCCVCFFNCSVYIRHWPGKKIFPPKHSFLCFRNEKRTIAFGGIWARAPFETKGIIFARFGILNCIMAKVLEIYWVCYSMSFSLYVDDDVGDWKEMSPVIG